MPALIVISRYFSVQFSDFFYIQGLGRGGKSKENENKTKEAAV